MLAAEALIISTDARGHQCEYISCAERQCFKYHNYTEYNVANYTKEFV